MRVRVLSASLVAAAALSGAALVAATPAAADFGDPVNCQQNPSSPSCSVIITLPGRAGGGGGDGGTGSTECHDPAGKVAPCELPGKGWLGSDGCYYDGPYDKEPHGQVPPQGSPPGKWYYRTCSAPWGSEGAYWNFVLDPVQVTPAQLAERAVGRLTLPLPDLRTNPGANLPQLVYVPTWIWADAASWNSQQATAAAGGLSVTATAKPVTMTVQAGDGLTVTCQGPGTAWAPGTNPAAASGTCGHTYTRAGVYTLSATVTWEVTWAGGGATGTVPNLTTTSNLRLSVTESQALNH